MHAVIFDVDGTLIQSDAADDRFFSAAIHEVLGNVHLRPSWAMYTQFTSAGILTEILGDNSLEVTAERVATVRDCFVSHIRRHVTASGPFDEVPGARAFVQNLLDSDLHRVAYATGGWHAAAQLKLSTSNFPLAAIPLATSDDRVERQEIMLHALRQLGHSFETVTYYGDGNWDAVAAKALGWRFVPVGRKLGGLLSYGARDDQPVDAPIR